MEKLGKLVNKKLKGQDSYYTVNTHSTEDILQSAEPFISYTPSTPSMKQVIENAVDDTIKFYAELKEIKTEVMVLKSFVLEQFLIIKQKTKPTSEASQCRYCSDNRELTNTLLDQTECLRKEIFSKNNIQYNLLNMDNKNCNNIQNFSCKSINDKSEDKSYDNMSYEIPKRTISSNGIKDDNTKSINFLSPNRFQHLSNYATQDTNTSNTVTSPHNLNITRKDECSHKNLTVTRNPSDRKSNYARDTNTSNTVTSPHNVHTTRKDKLPHKILTVTRNSSDRKSKSNNNMAPETTIIRDLVVRKVFGDKLSNSLNNNHHVIVHSFAGAKTQCIEDYIKPTIKLSPNQIIIHCGTNDLRSNEEPKTIADNIINLAKKAKSDVHEVAISGIIPRRDQHNQKAKQVNDILKQSSVEGRFLSFYIMALIHAYILMGVVFI